MLISSSSCFNIPNPEDRIIDAINLLFIDLTDVNTEQAEREIDYEPPAPNALLNLKQACDYLQVSESTIRTLCKRKELKHSRHGNHGAKKTGAYRFRRDWLDDWLASKTKTPKAKAGRPTIATASRTLKSRDSLAMEKWGNGS